MEKNFEITLEKFLASKVLEDPVSPNWSPKISPCCQIDDILSNLAPKIGLPENQTAHICKIRNNMYKYEYTCECLCYY